MALRTQIFTMVPLIATPHFVPLGRRNIRNQTKTRKTLFDVCSSFRSSCAKRYALVFKSELLRQAHTTYPITIVITNIKKKNIGSTNLKNILTLPIAKTTTIRGNSELVFYCFSIKEIESLKG